MVRNLKASLLAAAVVSVAAASQAQASFTYDLRFASGQAGATDPHNVTIDGSSPTTYTLQLWGQITGDTNLTNDGYISGFVGVTSLQGAGGAFTTGGITGAALGTHAQDPTSSATVGNSAAPDINHDGVTDWGSTTTTFNTINLAKYLKWAGGATPGYIDGTTDAQSEQIGPNTWEILLATFTVNVGALGTTGATTSFNVFAPLAIKTNAVGGQVNGLIYIQDGGQFNQGIPVGDTVATFTAVPEPTSLGLLALGGLALLNRRRKA